MDLVVFCEVGHLSAHDYKSHLAMGSHGEGLKGAQDEAQLIPDGLLVGPSVGPGNDAEMAVDFGLDCAAEKVVDFGDHVTKPSLPPPVGFGWKFLAGSWALFPGCGLGLQVDGARPKDYDEKTGKDIQLMVKDSQDKDLDSDDSVTEFEHHTVRRSLEFLQQRVEMLGDSSRGEKAHGQSMG